MVDLSIVIPVYQTEHCLKPLHERLTAVLNTLGITYEIILIEDRSPDNSWQVLESMASQDSHIRAYQLSRNFGQQAAITAGLAKCSGQHALVMDCDLQDPPETIPELYQKALAGYDVVLARRKAKQHSFFRKFSSKLYFKLLNKITLRPIDGEYGCFSIISRKVIDSFLTIKAQNRHYLLILFWLGFNTASIEYKHAERYHGNSSYTLATLFKHGLEGLFFQSTTLLRWIIYIGFGCSVFSLFMALGIIIHYFLYSTLSGWTSLSVFILWVGGMLMISIGVIGIYIGQMFEQVKGQPLYVIDKEACAQ